ncbi:MAG: sodium:alanine symporter family protein [Anaerotruncus sp.]|nr:sodium:alanine symporter family protein [Anaerotruncus sp.]
MEMIAKAVTGLVGAVNGFLWDYALLFLLCGTGIYFSVRLRFVQVRKFGAAFKAVFGNVKLFGTKADREGMSSFQSLATAIAAQVGTGNIAGAASAIYMGGPGAIFWMWVSAFFGMATIYGEATLAQKYKTQVDGQVTGGPVYYIQAAFRGGFGKVLAAAFSVMIILALGFMGNMVQSNSIGVAFYSAFGVNKLLVGVMVAAVAGFIFLGGVKRIASVTEKIVPIMAAFYVLGSFIIIFGNLANLGSAFAQIFVGAFNPQAIAGGVIGLSVQKAIRYGVARGLFSNEAGMGSTPHAHALAKVEHPCEQGLVAMMGVFIDTFIVLTMTALTIIITDKWNSGLEGVELAQSAFSSFYGNAGYVFIAISLLFFAFSTIVGWYFFGEQNVKYLFGKGAVKIYAVLVVIFVVIGSTLKVQLVWDLSDMFNGLMVIPNLLGVLALSGVVVSLNQEYEQKK